MTAKAPTPPSLKLNADTSTARFAKPRGRKAVADGFDMEVLGRMEQVTPPKQARSEQSLQRVLSALEGLLKIKPFAEISIPEISLDSKCSTATIYSRFRDKNSILAALHESRRDRMMRSIQEELTPERWAGRTLDELVSTYAARIVGAYQREHNLYFAALTMGDKDIYERGAQSIAFAQECFRKTLPVLSDPPGSYENLPLAIRTIFALVQQRTIFSGVALVENNDLPVQEIANQDTALLVRAFKAIMA
ncbi:MAG TPA: TetR/AcrR family transcriptional regulator [Alicycliphilus sp.]|nr:TetR/AcrR family transcriptional regulator [Alicycliphilus sp.]